MASQRCLDTVGRCRSPTSTPGREGAKLEKRINVTLNLIPDFDGLRVGWGSPG